VTGVHANSVTIPIEALVPEGEGFRVYVVDSAGIAHARPVTVAARSEDRAEITSGLAAGETVVTAGAYGVTDSVKVRASKP
jgi:membrane fusion protein (multidrug efflux system)